MCRLRAFLLWAVMLAIPFQGLAAVSQAFCEPASVQAAVTVTASTAHGVFSHDHAAPDGDTAHKCGTCGACQAAALMPSAPALAVPHLPAADLVAQHSALRAIAPRSRKAPLAPDRVRRRVP